MSSGTRGPRNRASKLPVADKPQFGPKKKKPQGSKVRKSKYSPAGPSHGAVTSSCFFSADGDPSAAGSKAMEQKIARIRRLHEWSKDACYFYNPRELRCAPGTKVEEPKFHPCPHQGAKNTFDFLFCKPDCPRRFFW
ncbi:hypothetical protein M0R45_013445 [Rubus argutus]|uniref:Uncharacterized protein n=1 Tax=Rubus argutus TaxID=59490 RepID=A0AAW1XL75_RUBAR